MKTLRKVRSKTGTWLLGIRVLHHRRLIYALLLSNAVSVLLFALRLIGAENFRYWFMLWNLVLAWVAPLIAWWLMVRLRQGPWRDWRNLLLTIAWLGFLPNSFYMVSDLIHVQVTGEINIIFDAVLFTSFIFNGFIAGFLGTMLLHRELLKRVNWKRAWVMIAGLFVLCGYAIYLGRVLRWNTWDALVNPAALVFDISDTIINPLAHMDAYLVTFSFALLISTFYVIAWEVLRSISIAQNR